MLAVMLGRVGDPAVQEGDVAEDAHLHIMQGQISERARLGNEVQEFLPVPEDQVREGGGEIRGQELRVPGDVAVLVGVDVVVVQRRENMLVGVLVVPGWQPCLAP